MALIKNKIFIGRIILSGICILFLAMTFHTENRTSGWYQQFLPTNLPNFQVSDVFFLDSLNGWAVTGNGNPNDTSGYILKTTNGGDNWSLKFTDMRDFTRVKFINSKTGFVCGGYGNGVRLLKSTNGGDNWYSLLANDQIIIYDMSVLNEDTIWIVSLNGFYDAVLRTTNGGISWEEQYSWGSLQRAKIYMYNARIGFICNSIYLSDIRKTTNGGNNWSIVAPNETFYDMYFADSLTGWKAGGDNVKKATNGGINWIQQTLPEGGSGQIIITYFERMSKYNKDTIWGAGGQIAFPNSRVKAILYRTTNQGNNWLYQIPDTSINIGYFYFVQFINHKIGWAYCDVNKGIHTIVGGDTTFLSGLQKISNEIPNDYILHQNFPNPFNPRTVIGYEIKKTSFVRLDVFDITGKEVVVMVNKKQSAGKYEVDFMGKFSPSGIYFYRLMADGKIIDTKKMLLVK